MLNVFGFRAFGSEALVVDVAASRFLFENSAAVSFVANSGHVTRVKYRSAIPRQVVTSSRSLSDELVCIRSLAKECQVPRTKSNERTDALCGSGRRPSIHSMMHYLHTSGTIVTRRIC